MDYNEFVLAMKAVAVPAWNMFGENKHMRNDYDLNLIVTGTLMQKGCRMFARDV